MVKKKETKRFVIINSYDESFVVTGVSEVMDFLFDNEEGLGDVLVYELGKPCEIKCVLVCSEDD
jgi:hypothetical protein